MRESRSRESADGLSDGLKRPAGASRLPPIQVAPPTPQSMLQDSLSGLPSPVHGNLTANAEDWTARSSRTLSSGAGVARRRTGGGERLQPLAHRRPNPSPGPTGLPSGPGLSSISSSASVNQKAGRRANPLDTPSGLFPAANSAGNSNPAWRVPRQPAFNGATPFGRPLAQSQGQGDTEAVAATAGARGLFPAASRPPLPGTQGQGFPGSARGDGSAGRPTAGAAGSSRADGSAARPPAGLAGSAHGDGSAALLFGSGRPNSGTRAAGIGLPPRRMGSANRERSSPAAATPPQSASALADERGASALSGAREAAGSSCRSVSAAASPIPATPTPDSPKGGEGRSPDPKSAARMNAVRSLQRLFFEEVGKSGDPNAAAAAALLRLADESRPSDEQLTPRPSGRQAGAARSSGPHGGMTRTVNLEAGGDLELNEAEDSQLTLSARC
mmetsp:Transcript_93988/g.166371  ORF Transcript_93988/g.166371 Transcript_93988/m.166371 type:complete len:444 (-) Transcript_93988:64-1395(-)